MQEGENSKVHSIYFGVGNYLWCKDRVVTNLVEYSCFIKKWEANEL